MPYRQDLDTGEWIEVDAQGNPVGQAQQGRVFTLPQSPKEQRQEARADNAAARADRAESRAAESASVTRRGLELREQEAAERRENKARGYDATEGERKAGAFLIRALGSNRNYTKQNVGPRSYVGQVMANNAPDLLNTLPGAIGNSPQRQVADTAQDEFIAASLRQDSGAAIPPEEMERQRRIYFPMPGDDEATIEAKAQARERAIEGLRQSAGRLAEQSEARFAAMIADEEGDDEASPAATPWDGPNTAAPRVATGGTRTVNKPEVASKAFSMLRAGAGYSTIKSALGEDGTGFTMSAFSEAKKRLAANPNANPFVFEQEVPTTLMQRAAGSDWGAAGIGAGNAVALGGLDELTGAINSVANGTSYTAERDQAQGAKEAAQALNPGAYFAGELGSGLTTGIGGGIALGGTKAAKALSSIPGVLGTGAAYGGTSGALEMNDNRALGAGIGTGAGIAGGLLGRYALGPLAERFGRLAGNAPKIGGHENALPNIPDSVQQNLADAQRLGVPYSLADADPALRVLAGSVTRKSPNARSLAEAVFEPRARGQADRLVNAVDERLAPVTDINARSADIMKGANIEAGPYYSRAKAQPALDDPVVGSILNTKTGKEALKRAYGLASDERRDPTSMGFILDDVTGEVRVNDAGRYYKPEAPHESGVISGAGNRAPDDLVTFARYLGGLRDQAGELSHMGFSNAGRKGVPFAGRDTRAGPLVSDSGLSIDEFGEAAFEAGFFVERPTTAQVLDALRGTYDGGQRVFRPDDQGIVDDYFARQADRYAANASDLSVDSSQPAGPRDFAPPESYGREVPLPTYETLHYVRQGFDDILDDYRDKVTNKVDLDNEGRAIAGLRRDLSDRLQQNDDFRQGDAIYAKGAKRRDALRDGFGVLPRNNVPFRDFDQRLSGARAYDDNFTQEADRLVPEMQRGFATSLADTADKTRLSGNPWEAVYGSPNQQQKIGAMFPDGAQDFGRQYGLERDMSRTAYETIGGSPTAARQAADQQMGDLVGSGLEIGADVLSGGGASGLGMILNTGRRMASDAMRLGVGKRGAQNAERLAPALFDTNPEAALEYLIDLSARKAAMQSRKQDYGGKGALLGAILAPSLLPPGG